MEEGGSGEWVTVAEGARRFGVTPKAIRERIRHGSIEWKPHGNSGRLVLAPPPPPPREPEGASREARGEEVAEELAELRDALAAERVARARAEERAETAQALAQGEVEAARRVAAAEIAAMREQLNAGVAARNAVIEELTAAVEREATRADKLAAELHEARRPLLLRMIEALRRGR